jgi:hypothetical protein
MHADAVVVSRDEANTRLLYVVVVSMTDKAYSGIEGQSLLIFPRGSNVSIQHALAARRLYA